MNTQALEIRLSNLERCVEAHNVSYEKLHRILGKMNDVSVAHAKMIDACNELSKMALNEALTLNILLEDIKKVFRLTLCSLEQLAQSNSALEGLAAFNQQMRELHELLQIIYSKHSD